MKEKLIELYLRWCNSNLSDQTLAELQGVSLEDFHKLVDIGEYYHKIQIHETTSN